MAMQGTGAFVGIFGTLYSSFVLDVKTTTTEFKIPFIAENSTAEFALNLAMQFIVFVHGLGIYYGIECTMSIFENFTTVSAELIRNELMQMNGSNERKKLSELQLRALLRNILLQSQDFDRYVMLRFKSISVTFGLSKYELLL